ncbi:hypothetical protein [Luteimonas salinilitoris]|uniref:Uncharacterized protein n=1 Tax=Luteimonas salinilitoris TaxID=3237697 RepID=A0ABV4HQ73_9GAMM
MKKFLLVLALLLTLVGITNADDNRENSATSIASPTLRVDFPSLNSLIQFFYVERIDRDPSIEMYLTSQADATPRSYYLGKIEPEGGPPNIESVFTMDVDRDGRKELLVLARLEVRHSGLQTSGNYFRTYVYKANASSTDFSRLKDVEEKIGEGLDGTREGEKVHYRYRDAASIRKLLSRR